MINYRCCSDRMVEELKYVLLEAYKEGKVTKEEYGLHMPRLFRCEIKSIEFVDNLKRVK